VECRNAYRQIVYVDTPEVRVPSHIMPGSLGIMPECFGPWSGRHDSGAVLRRIFVCEENAKAERRESIWLDLRDPRATI
jgi:hypothetical protein